MSHPEIGDKMHMNKQSFVQVISYGKLPEYDSFIDAINATKNKIRREKSGGELRGKKISDYLFDGYSLILRLSNQEYLIISSHVEGVKWEVRHTMLPKIYPLREPIINIKFPEENNNESIYKWEWKKTLDLLINKSICALCPSETMLSLYVEDVPDLIFSVLIISEDQINKPFLFFDEE